MHIRNVRIVLTALAASMVLMTSAAAQQNPYLGHWNLFGIGDNAGSVYWLEVVDEGGQLKGRFLNRSGSPFPVHSMKIENGELMWEAMRNVKTPDRPGPMFRAKLSGGKLVGSGTVGERTVTFEGMRPYKWPAANANGKHTFGKPVELFDGKSLDTWDVQHKTRPMNWSIADGAMTNEKGANNLVSKEKFKDFKIVAEYKLEPGSNSGIYLRGRYEMQVLDDFGKPADKNSHMSIYGRTPATANASKAPGEWQTMEATVVGNRVTVILNGQKIHDNAAIEGITGGALDANETEPGPIMLQGDHGKVWYKKVTVTPITRAGT